MGENRLVWWSWGKPHLRTIGVKKVVKHRHFTTKGNAPVDESGAFEEAAEEESL